MKQFNQLTDAEKKKIRSVVENLLEQYRMWSSIIYHENIPLITEDKLKEIRAFCEKVDSRIEELPAKEKEIFQKKYIQNDFDYITDFEMYNEILDPPVSHTTYKKRRDKAMYRLAVLLNVEGSGIFD